MTSEGIFHDAHEVYAKKFLADEWTWVGTLQNRLLADRVAGWATEQGLFAEVRPV